VKELQERYFYIRLCANEHLSKDALKVAIARDEFHHRAALPNNFNERLTPAEHSHQQHSFDTIIFATFSKSKSRFSFILRRKAFHISGRWDTTKSPERFA
jgi:hypothetical protein